MSPSQVSRCGGGATQLFAHAFYNISGAATNVLSGVSTTLQSASSGHDFDAIAWDESGNEPQYNRSWTLPQIIFYTATLFVTWPAFTGDRYIEITVANPVTMLNVQTMPARMRGSVTPDHDIQTVTATWFGNGSGGFQTLQLNAFQASGVTRVVTPWGFTGVAHFRVPDDFV